MSLAGSRLIYVIILKLRGDMFYLIDIYLHFPMNKNNIHHRSSA